MAVNLEISASSKIMTMSYCPKANQDWCGINYRSQ